MIHSRNTTEYDKLEIESYLKSNHLQTRTKKCPNYRGVGQSHCIQRSSKSTSIPGELEKENQFLDWREEKENIKINRKDLFDFIEKQIYFKRDKISDISLYRQKLILNNYKDFIIKKQELENKWVVSPESLERKGDDDGWKEEYLKVRKQLLGFIENTKY